MSEFTDNIKAIEASLNLRDHIIAEQDALIQELRKQLAILEESLARANKEVAL